MNDKFISVLNQTMWNEFILIFLLYWKPYLSFTHINEHKQTYMIKNRHSHEYFMYMYAHSKRVKDLTLNKAHIEVSLNEPVTHIHSTVSTQWSVLVGSVWVC